VQRGFGFEWTLGAETYSEQGKLEIRRFRHDGAFLARLESSEHDDGLIRGRAHAVLAGVLLGPAPVVEEARMTPSTRQSESG
jgi:hypothetical protein